MFVLRDVMFQGSLPLVITPVDLTTDRAGRPLRFPGGATSMVLSPNGRTLYVSAAVNTALIVLVDVATGRERAAIRVPGDALALAITPMVRRSTRPLVGQL